MPSRRSLLAAGGTAATVTLPGCSSGPDRTGWTFDQDRDLRPDDASVVARTRIERTDCPHGAVEFEAVAYDPGTDDLVLVTRPEVVPGVNLDECEGEWGQEGVDVTHDWSGLVSGSDTRVSRTSDLVPVNRPGGQYGLQDRSDIAGGIARWTVRTAAPESTVPYAFRSTYGPADGVGAGDELADISVEVPLSSGGLLGGSETLSLSTTLTYGRREG